eukprot:gb/GFBE01012664.1/.p1 GENE.gb/GFBE01012664.1/~~gb/GFBE01012664.1/.p1  ORF type:complete len:510 (+),score=98.51 gb/GFBE01012664.1/:1-1530(+)
MADEVSDTGAAERETAEWHALLLDLDEVAEQEHHDVSLPSRALALPPAPAVAVKLAGATEESAVAIAGRVIRLLCSPDVDGTAAGLALTCNSNSFDLLSAGELQVLCAAAAKVLRQEDMVVELQPPVKIFGALHGQIFDLLSHFRWHRPPTRESSGDLRYTSYLFLGNYADRGGHSLEVLTLLLSLKVFNPSSIVLLRGVHESRHLNYHLGLREECMRRLGQSAGVEIFENLNRTFECMSLAAVVGDKLLALGPGRLASSLTRVDQLRKLRKPLVVPHPAQPRPEKLAQKVEEQLLLELFTPLDLLPSLLGSVEDAEPERLLRSSRLSAVVTGHSVPARGFSAELGSCVRLRLCSCLDYCDLPGGNDAAILCVTKQVNSGTLEVRPRFLTARVAELYSVLGSQRHGMSRAPRWPPQRCPPSPGRRLSGVQRGPGIDLLPDRTVAPETLQGEPPLYPVLGCGRVHEETGQGQVLKELDPQNPSPSKHKHERHSSRPPRPKVLFSPKASSG